MKNRILLLAMLLVSACARLPEPTSGPDVPITGPPIDSAPTLEAETDPLAPQPGDADLIRGDAYLRTASLLIRESFPPQTGLTFAGELPTACHQLRVEISPPDPENRIVLEVYTVVDPEQVCTQVLEPFDESLNLGSFPTGHYTVWVNSKLAGEFDS